MTYSFPKISIDNLNNDAHETNWLHMRLRSNGLVPLASVSVLIRGSIFVFNVPRFTITVFRRNFKQHDPAVGCYRLIYGLNEQLLQTFYVESCVSLAINFYSHVYTLTG